MLGLALLRLQDVDIRLGEGELRLRRSQRRLRADDRRCSALLVGGRLFEPLLRAETGEHQLLRAVELQRGALRVGGGAVGDGVGGGHLGVGLRDRRGLRFDLSANARDGGVLRRDLVLGRFDGELIIARVDPRQDIAGAHVLIVGDVDLGNVAGDLRRDDHRVGPDIGVVGRHQEPSHGEIVIAPMRAVGRRADHDQRQQQSSRRSLRLRRRDNGLRFGRAGECRGGDDVLGHAAFSQTRPNRSVIAR